MTKLKIKFSKNKKHCYVLKKRKTFWGNKRWGYVGTIASDGIDQFSGSYLIRRKFTLNQAVKYINKHK